MPLREVQSPHDFIELLKVREARFLIFFSSRLPENNQLWCPDCLAVEEVIEDTFGSASQPSAVIVYVGQKSEWKASGNFFRQEPWKVEVIPTIIKVDEAGKEIGRSVDGQNSIPEELPLFIQ